ncbi:MAG TPA: orotidine-5'-phosphate decarboxylase [Anaerolineae bacterium]|nr:orotidine-5'-phosphate decarboxylase [Anaerolineae bacterium]
MSLSFDDRLVQAVAANRSLLCVGLDPDPAAFPACFDSRALASGQALLDWGRRLIDQTADLVCCYKPNVAFYEQFGAAGWEALRQTIAAVPAGIPVLLDAKRGDIGSTATAYARAAFDVLGADAVTLSPYLGRDSVAPFLAYPGKAAFVLCYTSNPSAAVIQEFGQDQRLFEHVVRQAMTWGEPGQIGLVVGATQPQALARVRALLAGRPCWILAPGVGAQGGDLKTALAAGLDAECSGLLVPVSRHVIYADDPRTAARMLRDEINEEREEERIPQRMRTTDGEGPSGFPSIPSFPSSPSPLILALHDAGCVQFGEFTLASGVQSPIYLDLRRMASYPGLLRMAAAAYADLLRPLHHERLAAVPYAALTIGAAVALATDKPLIYPRKEVKAYGTSRSIEGDFQPGQRAAVIEDLVTSAGSVLRAIQTLEAAGLAVSDVVVLIDREQGGQQNLAAAGYWLHAALTMTQIVDVLEAVGRISSTQAVAVRNYLRTPPAAP